MFGFIRRKEFESEIEKLKKENKDKLEGLEHLIKHPNGEITTKFDFTDCLGIYNSIYYVYKGVKIRLYKSLVESTEEQRIKIESSNVLINGDKAYISFKADRFKDEKYFVVDLDKKTSVETDKDFKVQY